MCSQKILKPLNCSILPKLALTTPLPIPDITPPVTNTNLQSLVILIYHLSTFTKYISNKNNKYQTDYIIISREINKYS